jgi:hypothetical protein
METPARLQCRDDFRRRTYRVDVRARGARGAGTDSCDMRARITVIGLSGGRRCRAGGRVQSKFFQLRDFATTSMWKKSPPQNATLVREPSHALVGSQRLTQTRWLHIEDPSKHTVSNPHAVRRMQTVQTRLVPGHRLIRSDGVIRSNTQGVVYRLRVLN